MRRSDRSRRWRSGRGVVARGRDAGYVTAETAVVVPSLVAVVGMLLWGLLAVAGALQTQDAARAGARAAARGEPPSVVRETARSAAPSGAAVEWSREGDLVRVRVEARTAGPGPLSLPLEAEAVALAEDSLAGTALPVTGTPAAAAATATGRSASGGDR
nr:TadE family type IV pilus minor pilin [Streptomyces sp. RKND-216]